MATKWKYATIPASRRLEMLKEGNDELYNEEIARTKDSISNRLAAGLDVSEQMKWADTVSYNHNLSKAKGMGIDESNVTKDGYAQRLFGDMTESVGRENVSTPEKPKEILKQKYYDDYKNMDRDALSRSVLDSYIGGINKRANLLSAEYKSYVKELEKNYEKKIKNAYSDYNKNESIYEEKNLNSGYSKNGGRSVTEKAKAKEALVDYINALTAEKNDLIAKAFENLKRDLYDMSTTAMQSVSDEYYRYNDLLSDAEKSEYQKLRDGTEDEKWRAEFEFKKGESLAKSDLDERKFEFEKQKEANDMLLSDRELEMRKNEFDADNLYRNDKLQADNLYRNNKLYADTQLAKQKNANDAANDSKRLELDREKFEHQKAVDWEDINADKEKRIAERGKKTTETESDDIYGLEEKKPVTNPDDKEYGRYYEDCLDTAHKMYQIVDYDENTGRYYRRYSDVELLEWIKTFELSDKEKESICTELGIEYR